MAKAGFSQPATRTRAENSPYDVADLLQREMGPDGAEMHLQRAIASSNGKRRQRAIAALGELRKFSEDSERAPEAQACSMHGCRATNRLQRVDGRILCEYCAIEQQR
jgi:hypothetical protein